MNSTLQSWKINPTFSEQQGYHESSFCSPRSVLALSLFADTEVGHNRRMSNTIGRHPVTLRVGTHLIFPLSTQAADLYISCNLDSQNRLDLGSMCLVVREEVWNWQEVLLRGVGGGCGLFVLSFRKRAYGFSRRNAGS